MHKQAKQAALGDIVSMMQGMMGDKMRKRKKKKKGDMPMAVKVSVMSPNKDSYDNPGHDDKKKKFKKKMMGYS